jgi:hypothetical protein
MFEIYGTPGVDIYISPSIERRREHADTRRWHFNEGLEIIVVMNSPSNDLNDSHVSWSLARAGEPPIQPGSQTAGGSLSSVAHKPKLCVLSPVLSVSEPLCAHL